MWFKPFKETIEEERVFKRIVIEGKEKATILPIKIQDKYLVPTVKINIHPYMKKVITIDGNITERYYSILCFRSYVDLFNKNPKEFQTRAGIFLCCKELGTPKTRYIIPVWKYKNNYSFEEVKKIIEEENINFKQLLEGEIHLDKSQIKVLKELWDGEIQFLTITSIYRSGWQEMLDKIKKKNKEIWDFDIEIEDISASTKYKNNFVFRLKDYQVNLLKLLNPEFYEKIVFQLTELYKDEKNKKPIIRTTCSTIFEDKNELLQFLASPKESEVEEEEELDTGEKEKNEDKENEKDGEKEKSGLEENELPF